MIKTLVDTIAQQRRPVPAMTGRDLNVFVFRSPLLDEDGADRLARRIVECATSGLLYGLSFAEIEEDVLEAEGGLVVDVEVRMDGCAVEVVVCPVQG